MTDNLDELCHGYRTMLATQQQLTLRVACCTQQVEHLPLMRERLATLGQQQRKLTRELRAAERAIRQHTATLPDERLRTIVELRYLGGMSWGQVSELMGLELRWVMRLHQRAMGNGNYLQKIS